MNSENFFLFNDTVGTKKVETFGNSVILNYPCNKSSSCTYYYSSLDPGTYAFEVWGAQGGLNGGKGGYSFGVLRLNTKTKFYLVLL